MVTYYLMNYGGILQTSVIGAYQIVHHQDPTMCTLHCYLTLVLMHSMYVHTVEFMAKFTNHTCASFVP